MKNAALILQEWEAEGHPVETAWLEFVATFGLTIAGVLFLALLGRAILRRRLYSAVDVLGPTEQEAVHRALVEAEKKTVGEIVPVVLERSDAHPAACWISAVVSILLGSALFANHMPWGLPLGLLTAQTGLGALGYAAAWYFADFRRLFVRPARAIEMAEEQALQEFHRNGLHETAERTGVLIFVSLFEHRVIVLADVGIHAKVGPDAWAEVDAAILEGIRAGSLADGLVHGIERAGALLAEHFPWREGNRNEIPDRLIVRRE